MEVVNPCYSVLSNLEVMEALKDIKDTKKRVGLRNLATITYEILQYLEDTACKNQNHDSILTFLNDLTVFNLTTNESLMLVNDPPTSPLHIQLLIEDSEERFTEEQVADLLELSKRHFR